MRRFLPGLLSVLAGAALAGALNVRGRAGPPPAPRFDWAKAAPETQGLSGPKLETLRDALAARRTKALLIVRNDRIVLEWYSAGHGPRQTHYTASLVKALVGALLLLLGLDDGRFDLDEPVAKYVPQWADDPAKARITFRQLATHCSGLADAAQNRPGWEEDFWKRRPDPFTVARDKAPLVAAPGKRFRYSNPGMAMLAYAVTAGYRGAPGTDHRTLLKKRVMDLIGVPPGEWSIGYGQTYKVDGLDLVANWGGGAYTARAVARVGRLLLRRGDWEGKRLLSAKGVERMLAPAGTPPPDRPAGDPHPASGLGWWLNADGVWPRVPRDAFAGAGAGHQILLVVPSQKLIVVRMGGVLNHPTEKETFWGAAEKHFLNPLLEALGVPGGPKAGRAPYPPRPVIGEIRWAPKESTVRKARGSDNWPIRRGLGRGSRLFDRGDLAAGDDEVGDRDAGRDVDQFLLDAAQELADAAGEVLGFVLADFPDGDREAAAAVVELAIVRVALAQERSPEAPHRECHATATTAEESQKNCIQRRRPRAGPLT
jgi:CubicO group peptidase (beta-lactamase class C family)